MTLSLSDTSGTDIDSPLQASRLGRDSEVARHFHSVMEVPEDLRGALRGDSLSRG